MENDNHNDGLSEEQGDRIISLLEAIDSHLVDIETRMRY